MNIEHGFLKNAKLFYKVVYVDGKKGIDYFLYDEIEKGDRYIHIHSIRNCDSESLNKYIFYLEQLGIEKTTSKKNAFFDFSVRDRCFLTYKIDKIDQYMAISINIITANNSNYVVNSINPIFIDEKSDIKFCEYILAILGFVPYSHMHSLIMDNEREKLKSRF